MDTITLNGRTYRIDIEPDQDMGAPWEEHDCHGIVSEWTTRDKGAGERVLSIDQRYGLNGKRRFYDFSATTKKAKAEGWGLNESELTKLANKLNRKPTHNEIIAEAVRLDYECLRGWCNGSWYWCGVIVTDITEDEGAPIDYTHAVWGIDSDSPDYMRQVAKELAEEASRAYAVENRFADAMACGV